ncbi:hypothetical protein VPNG_07218 [Cytospora leucostoma]|uniref:DUF1771 domain-containing protein n=1 Tax=Cytospora leucostoma TaxID=1230097 RepID=A0A423WJW8_9PEZI|nr:hypothetical protein VPNG_07218 [Cytospora leucostoma]
MGNQETDDTGLLMSRLIDEFRSVLDETVIIAIVGDYDLTLQYDEARGILEALSKDAIAEDPYSFSPAGLDGHTDHQHDPEAQWSPRTDSCNSPSGSKPLTDFTEPTDFSDMLSERFESLELPDDVNVATLDEGGKVAELKIMFPSLRELDLRFALKKADGDFIKTCEELLNTQYLEENGLRPKGIEGAFRDDELVGRSNTDTSKEKAGKAKTVQPKQQQQPRKTYSELTIDAAAARDSTAQSFAAASQAYRRGRSDALFRPVAGVLSERAREQLGRSRAVQSETYEALVDEQSPSPTVIDLHGVPVADGHNFSHSLSGPPHMSTMRRVNDTAEVIYDARDVENAPEYLCSLWELSDHKRICFTSIDLEGPQEVITELGLAFQSKNYSSRGVRHIIVKDTQHMKQKTPKPCGFGVTSEEFDESDQLYDILDDFFAHQLSVNQTVVLTGYDIKNDLIKLENNCSWRPPRGVSIIDASMVFKTLSGKSKYPSQAAALATHGVQEVPTAPLHNAANDAWYALEILSREAEQAVRQKDDPYGEDTIEWLAPTNATPSTTTVVDSRPADQPKLEGRGVKRSMGADETADTTGATPSTTPTPVGSRPAKKARLEGRRQSNGFHERPLAMRPLALAVQHDKGAGETG